MNNFHRALPYRTASHRPARRGHHPIGNWRFLILCRRRLRLRCRRYGMSLNIKSLASSSSSSFPSNCVCTLCSSHFISGCHKERKKSVRLLINWADGRDGTGLDGTGRDSKGIRKRRTNSKRSTLLFLPFCLCLGPSLECHCVR